MRLRGCKGGDIEKRCSRGRKKRREIMPWLRLSRVEVEEVEGQDVRGCVRPKLRYIYYRYHAAVKKDVALPGQKTEMSSLLETRRRPNKSCSVQTAC